LFVLPVASADDESFSGIDDRAIASLTSKSSAGKPIEEKYI